MLLINLRFFLLLTFDLPGLVLEMENGSPLRMVEGGRSVEHSCRGQCIDGLQIFKVKSPMKNIERRMRVTACSPSLQPCLLTK